MLINNHLPRLLALLPKFETNVFVVACLVITVLVNFCNVSLRFLAIFHHLLCHAILFVIGVWQLIQ